LVIDFWYVDKTGKRQRFRHKAQDQHAAGARLEADRLMRLAAETGNPYATPVRSMTFAQFTDGAWTQLYLPRFRPATRERYVALMGQGIKQHFGDMMLDAIDAIAFVQYTAQLAQRGIQSRAHTSLVSRILRAAVECKVLPRLPELPRHSKASGKLPDCPNTDEVHAMLLHARSWVRLVVALAAYAGLRSGEVRALQVRDVDLTGGVIHVRRAFSGGTECTPKGDHERIVPIAPELVELLTEAIRRKLPLARVVLTELGTTPTRQHVLYRLTRVQKRHGLRHRSFHSLRHYFCSSLLRRGATVEAVRVVAGHMDLATTARYVHADIDEIRAAMVGQRLGSGN